MNISIHGLSIEDLFERGGNENMCHVLYLLQTGAQKLNHSNTGETVTNQVIKMDK